jgi:hypothetical protein
MSKHPENGETHDLLDEKVSNNLVTELSRFP